MKQFGSAFQNLMTGYSRELPSIKDVRTEKKLYCDYLFMVLMIDDYYQGINQYLVKYKCFSKLTAKIPNLSVTLTDRQFEAKMFTAPKAQYIQLSTVVFQLENPNTLNGLSQLIQLHNKNKLKLQGNTVWRKKISTFFI